MKRWIASLALVPLALVGIAGSAMADPANVGKVRIIEYGSNAVGKDTSSNRNEEFVRLMNVSGADVDVEGWKLHDTYQDGDGGWGNAVTLSASKLPESSPFRKDHDSDPATPDRFVLSAGGQIYVYNGSGTDTTPTNQTAAIYRNYKHHWNNGGDTIYLRDNGGTVVHWIKYSPYRVRIG